MGSWLLTVSMSLPQDYVLFLFMIANVHLGTPGKVVERWENYAHI